MRRRYWWIIGTLTIIAAAIGWKVHHDNQLRQLSIISSTIPVEVVLAEDIGKKPTVDIMLPVFGQIIWPNPSSTLISTNPDDPMGVNPRLIAGVLIPSRELFGTKSWVLHERVRKILTPNGFDLFPYIACPRVFGDDSILATVKVPNPDVPGSSQEFHVRLPPKGKPAPKLPSLTTSVNGWKVKLTPKPWVAPAFEIQYEVSVEDAQRSTFSVEVESSSDSPFFSSSAICEPEKPGLLTVDGPQFRRSPHPNGVIASLRLTRLEGKPAKLTVHKSNRSGVLSVSIVDATLNSYVKVEQSVGSSSSGSNIFALRMGKTWWTDASGFEAVIVFLAPFHDGQIVDGDLYEPTPTQVTAKLRLDMPDMTPYW